MPSATIYSSINPNTFQPYIDGKTIPQQPSEAGTKVPTIYGSSKLIGYNTELLSDYIQIPMKGHYLYSASFNLR